MSIDVCVYETVTELYLLGLDGSCPLGPVLVAPSEVDPHQLDIKAIHNGAVVQDSNTRYDPGRAEIESRLTVLAEK